MVSIFFRQKAIAVLLSIIFCSFSSILKADWLDFCSGLLTGVSLSDFSEEHRERHNDIIKEIYSENKECRREHHSSKEALSGILKGLWDEAPKYRLLGILSQNLDKYSRKVAALLKDDFDGQKKMRQEAARLLTIGIFDAITDHRSQIKYTYFRFLLLSTTRDYLINNNPVLPGWRDEEQEGVHHHSALNLIRGCQAGWFSSAPRHEAAEFFNRVLGINEEAAYQVMDAVEPHQYSLAPLFGLTSLVVTMAVEATEDYVAARGNMTSESIRQYLASVAYQSVQMLYYMLEHPETVSSNMSYKATFFGKRPLLIKEILTGKGRMEGEQPYPIPKRYVGWATGRRQEMDKLDLLGKYLSSRNCAHHIPGTDPSARTYLW